jgi:hypothetical protein
MLWFGLKQRIERLEDSFPRLIKFRKKDVLVIPPDWQDLISYLDKKYGRKTKRGTR